MMRREFIMLIGCAAASVPIGARAQQSDRLRRIGVLAREDDARAQARLALFRQGLSELGWSDGRNINVDYRWHGADATRAKSDE